MSFFFFPFFPFLNGIFPYKALCAEFCTQFPLLKLYQSLFRVSEDVHSDFNSEQNTRRGQGSNSFSLQIIASNHRGENVSSLPKYIVKIMLKLQAVAYLYDLDSVPHFHSLSPRQTECMKTVSYSLKRRTKGNKIIN